jgi:anti-sigma B factor antagonist
MSATQPRPDHYFRLEVEPEREVVRVCPSGEVDLATVDSIHEKIEDLKSVGFARVALDLRGVTFLDSTGIRLILELSASSRADGWDFAVIEGPADVQRVFELAGVQPLVPRIAPAQLHHARWEGTWQ